MQRRRNVIVVAPVINVASILQNNIQTGLNVNVLSFAPVNQAVNLWGNNAAFAH